MFFQSLFSFRHIFELVVFFCRVSRKAVWTCWITVILPTQIFHLKSLCLKNNIYRLVGNEGQNNNTIDV